MATPFLGEVKIFSFNFPPRGWAFCNGQLLPINQNQALFALLGTTFGGNGQTNFALPDLRNRVAIHDGNNFVLGQSGGATSHTLTVGELPVHSHVITATNETQNSIVPGNAALLANVLPSESYAGSGADVMHPGMLTSTGGTQAHNNSQPSLALSFCIALQGIFPSQN